MCHSGGGYEQNIIGIDHTLLMQLAGTGHGRLSDGVKMIKMCYVHV